MKITWKEEQAFSLVEVLVALIAVSCISAALAPVITKKIKSNAVTVGTGVSGGVKFTMNCSEWGEDCPMCLTDKCIVCTKACKDTDYVDTPTCECVSCITKSLNCIECNANKCTKCADGYGLDSSDLCVACAIGQYSNDDGTCVDCPENYFCVNGSKTPCASDSFSPVNSTSCTLCRDVFSKCDTCNESECLTCQDGYVLKDGECKMISGSQEFTTAGFH